MESSLELDEEDQESSQSLGVNSVIRLAFGVDRDKRIECTNSSIWYTVRFLRPSTRLHFFCIFIAFLLINDFQEVVGMILVYDICECDFLGNVPGCN